MSQILQQNKLGDHIPNGAKKNKWEYHNPKKGNYSHALIAIHSVEENTWNDPTQAFSDFSWLKKNRQECHPMFIAIKNKILTQKYWLQVLSLVFL